MDAADQRAARCGLRRRPHLPGVGRFGAPDMTLTGALLIGLILVAMAWLVCRGTRATGLDPADRAFTPPPSEPASPR